jgi:hypothetical protein
MRRCLASTLAVSLLLAGFPALGDDDAPAPQRSGEASWYAQALARADSGLNVTNFWSKGPRMRAETVVAGHRIVTIVNGEWYYAYDSVGMQGIAIQRAEAARAQDRRRGRPFGNHLQTLEQQGAEQVGTEVLMGQKVDVYRVTDGRGKRTLWVTHDAERLPMRIEIFSRKTGSTQYTDYLKWMTGLPIEDAFFEPEPTVKLTRYSLAEYLEVTQKHGPTGPVPIFYADLLHGSKDGSEGD